MRRLYAAAFGITALAVLLIGGVLAWTSSANGQFNARTGNITVELADVRNTNNRVFPTGNFIAVQTGAIKNNTTTDPGIAVHITGGSVSDIMHRSPSCNAFIKNDGLGKPGVDGQVVVNDPSNIPPGGRVGGKWEADLRMGKNAPEECSGEVLFYTITVNVST